MNGVVAAQDVSFGEFTRMTEHVFVRRDQPHRPTGPFQVSHGSSKFIGVESPAALSRGEGRSGFGVDQLRCQSPRGSFPDLLRQLRAGLLDEQLDESRGVEIRDQRRWLFTSSETVPPRGLGRPVFLGDQSCVGSRTRPRAFRSASGSVAPTGERRATGVPRMVTTTSPPSAACRT